MHGEIAEGRVYSLFKPNLRNILIQCHPQFELSEHFHGFVPNLGFFLGFSLEKHYCVGWGAHSAMFCMLMSLFKKVVARRPKPNNFLLNCIFLEMKRSSFRHGILSNRALDLIGNVLNNCHIFYHHGPGTGSEYIKTLGGFYYYCSS